MSGVSLPRPLKNAFASLVEKDRPLTNTTRIEYLVNLRRLIQSMKAWQVNKARTVMKRTFLCIVTVLAVSCSGYRSADSSDPVPSGSPSPVADIAQDPGSALIRPHPKLTPGDTLEVTKTDVCVPGYSKKIRDVPEEVKREVYERYGISSHQAGDYEVDHLISLSLGGSNSIKNLWPESRRTERWNANVKDQLEDRLHKLVCDGKVDLETAQTDMAADWVKAYMKYVGPSQIDEPQNRSATSSVTGLIIGNKRSHVYHRPDCPGYNSVSEQNRVEFASVNQAEEAGYRLAGNCPNGRSKMG
jgi:hypothetical protein